VPIGVRLFATEPPKVNPTPPKPASAPIPTAKDPGIIIKYNKAKQMKTNNKMKIEYSRRPWSIQTRTLQKSRVLHLQCHVSLRCRKGHGTLQNPPTI
jgi:hypothetical protein